MTHPPKKIAAFSLIEVILAIGIASFTLIPIFGLLPLGLQSVKAANDESAAANTITLLASAIRGAASNNQLEYVADYGGTAMAISYKLGGAKVLVDPDALKNLGSDGLPSSTDALLNAQVEIFPPKTASELGTARISVAWPAVSAKYKPANAQNDASITGTWSNAQGYVSSVIRFLPR